MIGIGVGIAIGVEIIRTKKPTPIPIPTPTPIIFGGAIPQQLARLPLSITLTMGGRFSALASIIKRDYSLGAFLA
jgi:hypothetical protein